MLFGDRKTGDRSTGIDDRIIYSEFNFLNSNILVLVAPN